MLRGRRPCACRCRAIEVPAAAACLADDLTR